MAGVGAVAMIVLQGKIIADWFVGARFMIGISVSVCAFPIGMGLAQLVLPSVLMRSGMHAAFLTDDLRDANELARHVLVQGDDVVHELADAIENAVLRVFDAGLEIALFDRLEDLEAAFADHCRAPSAS